MNQLRSIIATVGLKRFIAFIILMLLNGGLFAAWHYYLVPQSTELGYEKRDAEAVKARLHQDIQNLPAKYEALKANEARYDAIIAKGFVQPQDRIVARTKIDAIRTEAGVRGIQYNIKPEEKVLHDESFFLTDEIIRSDMEFDFKALTDIDIRNFIDLMRENFPGLVVVRNVTLERGEALNEANLAAISQKQPVNFMSGKAQISWYNIVPGPDPTAGDPAAQQSQAFGGVQ